MPAASSERMLRARRFAHAALGVEVAGDVDAERRGPDERGDAARGRGRRRRAAAAWPRCGRALRARVERSTARQVLLARMAAMRDSVAAESCWTSWIACDQRAADRRAPLPTRRRSRQLVASRRRRRAPPRAPLEAPLVPLRRLASRASPSSRPPAGDHHDRLAARMRSSVEALGPAADSLGERAPASRSCSGTARGRCRSSVPSGCTAARTRAASGLPAQVDVEAAAGRELADHAGHGAGDAVQAAGAESSELAIARSKGCGALRRGRSRR